MQKTLTQKIATGLLACAGLSMLSTAAKADWIFSGVDGGAANTSVSSTTAGDPSLNISGVYASNTSITAGSGTWSSGTLLYYAGYGLGMGSDGTGVPNHALDNSGNTEGVLLSFAGSSVALSSINLGYISDNNSYTSNDKADVSLFRYTGTSAPTVVGAGATLTELLAAGWELVGNYANLSTGSNTVNTGGATSSWWLVTAYNSNYGTGTGLESGNDYFKLYSVAGTKTQNNTPEPGSLALAGLALAGVFYARRKAGKRSA